MIIDIIIVLGLAHGFGEECHWVKDILVIALHQDSITCII